MLYSISTIIWTDHPSKELSVVLNLFFLPNKLVSPSTVWTTKFSKQLIFADNGDGDVDDELILRNG